PLAHSAVRILRELLPLRLFDPPARRHSPARSRLGPPLETLSGRFRIQEWRRLHFLYPTARVRAGNGRTPALAPASLPPRRTSGHLVSPPGSARRQFQAAN